MMTDDLGNEGGGTDVLEAIEEPIAVAQPVRKRKPREIAVMRRDFQFAPRTLAEDTREVDVIVSAGSPVARKDWLSGQSYTEELSMEPSAIRLGRLNRGAPLLDSHDYYGGTRAILGAIVPGTARVEDQQLRARVRFSRSVDGERAFQDMKDGVLRNLSVGYLTHKYEVDETTSPPTHRAVDWEPHEVSAVAIPADPRAGFRSADISTRELPGKEDHTMSETAHAGSETHAASVETVAVAIIDQKDIDARVDAAIAAEETRRFGIEDAARKLELSHDFAVEHIHSKTPLAKFCTLAIDEAGKKERSAGPQGGDTWDRGGAPIYLPGLKRKEPQPGDLAMRMIAAVACGKKFGISPTEVARQYNLGELVVRALQASVGSAGGYMIPMELAAELIDLLRPRTIVRKATPQSRQISIPRGNLKMGRMNQGATIGYVGEGQSTGATQEVFGDINFSARKAKALVPVSNDLIRFAQGSADAIVRDDLIRQLAVLEDTAFLRGSGSVWTPKGIRNLALTGNVIPAAGSYTVSTAIADMTGLVSALEAANVPMTNPHWFMSSRSKNFFYDARDSVGGFLFRAEMDRGVFRGVPFSWTSSIPQNLGGGGNASEIYLVDMDEFIIADVPGLMIDASQEASYSPDGGATLVSSFDKDETVIRVIAEHDCNVRHSASIGVLTAVLYGT